VGDFRLEIEPAHLLGKSTQLRPTHPEFAVSDAGVIALGLDGSGDDVLQLPLRLHGGDYTTQHTLRVPLEDIQQGERRDLQVDLSPWLPVLGSLRILCNDAPTRGARFLVRIEDVTSGEEMGYVAGLSGEVGLVTFALPRGRASGWVRLGDSKMPVKLGPLTTEQLQAGHTVSLHTGEVRLRALGPDGVTPLEGVQFELDRPSDYVDFDPTDAEGLLDLGHTQLGPLRLRVYPKALADFGVRWRIRNAGGDPGQQAIDLGVRQIEAGRQTLDVVIPATAGYD
jgi:hypothetical protein